MLLTHVAVPTRARHRFLSAVLAGLVALVPMAGVLGFATPAAAADGVVTYVVSASAAANGTSHSVRVPAGVQAGDTMVLFLTTNSTAGTMGQPSGWELLQARVDCMTGRSVAV